MTDWVRVMREDWDTRAREDVLRHICRRVYPSMDAFYQEGKYYAIELTFPFLQRLEFYPAGKRVLEIGCGLGRLFPGFKDLGFGEIWGLDLSPEMLELARRLCPVSQANFALGDGQTLGV